MRRLARSLALAALLLAGCGGSGPDASAPRRVDDPAAARAALLRLGDLPRGWTTRSDPDDETLPCAALQRAKAAATARADADTFLAPEGSPQVSDVVSLFAGGAAAHRAFAELTSHDTGACLARETSRVRGDDGGRLTRATASRLLVGATADEVAGTRIATTFRARGEAIPVLVDVVTLRQGRGLARVTLSATRGPAAYALRAATLRAAGRRLTSAIAARDR